MSVPQRTHRHWGSSPLARGLPAARRGGVGHGRIIPARAGFTPVIRMMTRPCPDHPRSRGVYCEPRWRPNTTRGSSPLARGLPPRPRSLRSPHWIIPARAGFTRAGGLTPRGLCRIIPARAGFTASTASTPSDPPDHPRSRGVYTIGSRRRARRVGSSPLARGLPSACPASRRNPRIIPARAGFTRRNRGDSPHGVDHPRSRGVYRAPWRWRPAPPGSSPLARGLHAHPAPITHGARIIPARAGFTAILIANEAPRADHPRSRGVY